MARELADVERARVSKKAMRYIFEVFLRREANLVALLAHRKTRLIPMEIDLRLLNSVLRMGSGQKVTLEPMVLRNACRELLSD